MAESTCPSAHRKAIRKQATSHPMVTYIALAYAISWIAWLLSNRIDLGLSNGFGIIGSAGPALAAIIVSALLRPGPSGIPAGQRWRLFAIIAILALAVMAVRRMWITREWLVVAETVKTSSAFPSLMALLVDVLAAAVVALILSGVYSPRQGVSDLLRSLDLRHHPVRWYWWVIALGLYPIVTLLGNAISAGLGLPGPEAIAVGPWHLRTLDVLLTLLIFVMGGGGLEEPGWRGFALPALEKRYSPLRSSLVLAVIWALWHLPFFWLGKLQGGVLGMLFYLLVEIAPLSILFTAAFSRSGDSLPIAILLHASINVTSIYLPISSLASLLWLPLMVGLGLWMWRSPQTFASRPVPMAAQGGDSG